MSYYEIILILVLILAGYYVFQIGKEIIGKANAENEQTQYTDEQEIDITDDLVQFDVTEVDPSDIPIEDSVIKVEPQNSTTGKRSESSEISSTPILPFPMEVTKFHRLIQDYDPANPNPELDTIVFAISKKDDP